MDPHLGRHTRHQLITILLAGLAAYGGSLLAQPSGTTTHPSAVAIESTAAKALDVAGGIEAGAVVIESTAAAARYVAGCTEFGTGHVPLVGADGKINEPLSTTILDNLICTAGWGPHNEQTLVIGIQFPCDGSFWGQTTPADRRSTAYTDWRHRPPNK